MSQLAVQFVQQQLLEDTDKYAKFPAFREGDNITVNYRIVEGGKERVQSFKGDVLKRQGSGFTQTFTVRKISENVGVERTFPFYSHNIVSIVLHKRGKVSRARIYYIRELTGKKARIKERVYAAKNEGNK